MSGNPGGYERESESMSMAPIDQLPLAIRVYETLTAELMSGRRTPGERLKLDDVATELGVSHTPVREAFAKLEQTGFVERHPRRGYVVAPLLGASEISQLMDARLLMEPTMAELAAGRRGAEFLASLRTTIEAMEQAGESPDAPALVDCWLADEAFHTLISERSGNKFMAQAYRSLGGQMQRFRIIGGAGVSHARAACSEHQRIFEAIEAGAAEEAHRRMTAHLSHAKSRTLDDLRRANERMDEVPVREQATG